MKQGIVKASEADESAVGKINWLLQVSGLISIQDSLDGVDEMMFSSLAGSSTAWLISF